MQHPTIAEALCRLGMVDGLQLLGETTFVLRQQPAAAVAAVLAAEFGIQLPHGDGLLRLQPSTDGSVAGLEALVDALQKIARGEFDGVYTHEASSGDYVAVGEPQPGLRPPVRV
ncbi:MAG: hypothetical protein WAQ05_21195 [Rubrivivax sp.]